MSMLLYEFHCESCGHDFDEFAESQEYQKNKEGYTIPCPECGKEAHFKTIQLATHGHNHSSWSV
jgi:putative FmdB family regulatory protein